MYFSYGVPPDLDQLERDLPEIVEIMEEIQEERDEKNEETGNEVWIIGAQLPVYYYVPGYSSTRT